MEASGIELDVWWVGAPQGLPGRLLCSAGFVPLSAVLPGEPVTRCWTFQGTQAANRGAVCLRKAWSVSLWPWRKCNTGFPRCYSHSESTRPEGPRLLGLEICMNSLCASHHWLKLNSGPSQKRFLMECVGLYTGFLFSQTLRGVAPPEGAGTGHAALAVLSRSSAVR